MDQADFDAFYATSYAAICNQIFAMCGNRAEAEDCVQEAFAKAWSHREELTKARSPEGWVRMTAHNLSVSSWRKWRRQSNPYPESEESAAEPHTDERLAMARSLSKLTANHRRAIVLHYFAGLSVAEMAEEIGITVSTAKKWLSRGRQQLQGILLLEGVSGHER